MTDINKPHTEQELNESFGNLATLKLGKMVNALRQEYKAGQTRNAASVTGAAGNKIGGAGGGYWSPLARLGDTPTITNMGSVNKWADITKLYPKDGVTPLLVTLHHNNKPVMMLIKSQQDVSYGANGVMGFAYDFSDFDFDQTEIQKILGNTRLVSKNGSDRDDKVITKSNKTSSQTLTRSQYTYSSDKIDKWKELTGNKSQYQDKEFNNFQMWKAAVGEQMKGRELVTYNVSDDGNTITAQYKHGAFQQIVSTFDMVQKKGVLKDAVRLISTNDNISLVYGAEENLYGVALQVKEIRQIFELFMKSAGVSLTCNAVGEDPTSLAKTKERQGKMGSLPASNEFLSAKSGYYSDSKTNGQKALNDRLTKFKSDRVKTNLVDYGTDAGKLFAALKTNIKCLEVCFVFNGNFYKKTQAVLDKKIQLNIAVSNVISGKSVETLPVEAFECTEFKNAMGVESSYGSLRFYYVLKDGTFVPSHVKSDYKDFKEGL